VSGFSSGLLPYVFGRIEFRGVRRQIVEFNAVLFGFEPLSYLGTFVILGVVQDHVYLSTPVSGDELVQKGQKTIGVEPVHEAEVKFRTSADRYRSHHFQGIPCGRSLHHASDSLQSPVSENGACLLEAHFILIYQDAFLFLDFFLISGSSSSSQVACRFLSASESSCLGYCSENPNS
jgi:hypothetical protein